jgi:hypothetical protein
LYVLFDSVYVTTAGADRLSLCTAAPRDGDSPLPTTDGEMSPGREVVVGCPDCGKPILESAIGQHSRKPNILYIHFPARFGSPPGPVRLGPDARALARAKSSTLGNSPDQPVAGTDTAFQC